MSGNILKSLATVSGLTMLSRILGFVRQILIAGVIGAGGNPVADAFWAAFRLPNLFRRLFAEGAFQAAFIPLFQGKLADAAAADAHQEAKQFAEEILAGLILILLVLTLLVEVAAPLFVYTVASGFDDDPEKFALTTLYMRIMFPYLACMSLVGLLSGILNSLDRFMAFAGAPLLLNICQITAIALYAQSDLPVTGAALAVATAVSGVLQAVLLIWGARRQGYLLRLRAPRWTPGVSRLVKLGAPGFIAGAAVQINIVIGTNIASREPGAVSWLMNADQLYQLPLSVIGIALGVVLLPRLSRKVKTGDEAGAVDTLNRSLELSAMLTLPAAAAFLVMAGPICDALFRGIASEALSVFGGRTSAFTAHDVAMTGAALAFYGAGLPAFVWQKVFLPAFYAREDTRTPMRYALIAIALNTILSLALFPVMGFKGVALATSIAAWFQLALLAFRSRRDRHFTPDRRLLGRLPRIALAVIVMTGLLLWGLPQIETASAWTLNRTWIATLLLAGLGVVVYAIALLALGGARIGDYKALSNRS